MSQHGPVGYAAKFVANEELFVRRKEVEPTILAR